jgi:16S rRNA processing protein RimM
MQDNKLIIGRINGVYGVKGWVKIYSHTDPIGNILHYQPWWVKKQGQWVSMNVLNSHEPQGGKAIVAQIEGVDSREQAREMMGADIAIERNQLPENDQAFYWTDLIGCQVVNHQGKTLGLVTELVETGAHDVLRVKGDSAQYLIPFVFDVYVSDVDLEAKRINVDWDSADSEE